MLMEYERLFEKNPIEYTEEFKEHHLYELAKGENIEYIPAHGIIIHNEPEKPEYSGNSDGNAARLLVYEHDGRLRWSRTLDVGEPYSDIPVVGDVDNDGKMEIFVDVGRTKQLFAFRHDGTPMPGLWPVTDLVHARPA